jgi:6-phosphofructokinase 1
MIKALAVLTSGGDAPGMNAAVRAVVRRALDCNVKVYGIFNGYNGLLKGGDAIKLLKWEDVGGILPKGGTFLGTARSERFRTREGRRDAVLHLLEYGIEALVVIGGDGSLMGAHVLAAEWSEHLAQLHKDGALKAGFEGRLDSTLQIIGLPGSIDNDLYGTAMSIGADTALNHIVHALDDLSSTAASHERTFIVETMGRHCGYLALMATLAGGASWVLVPEEQLEMRWHQKMIQSIEKSRQVGRPHQMIIVAEGARHADGLPIRSDAVRKILNERLGVDARLTVLGHIQRGGSPTAFDRILATRLGVAAVDALLESPDENHCHMLGLIKNEVTATPLTEVVEKSQAVRTEIENGAYEKALELRGNSFRDTLALVKTLTRITPAQKLHEDGAVAILTGDADAPGMNAAVSVAARCLLNQGVKVYGSTDAFLGLIRGNFVDLGWNELVGWMNRPSSDIGTARHEFEDDDLARIAENIIRWNIKGIIAVGGWGFFTKIHEMIERRSEFEAFRIPMVLVPATIDNNLPCTEFTIGSDTALNNIIEAVDKIRHTAGATRRAFIVEVMGSRCGFLAMMSALASGAEKAYLPENRISLAELNEDLADLKTSFARGKRMVIYLRNESSSHHFTTDFIRRLLEEESMGQFEVRTAILGHVQRGGMPSAFDRILASRMGASAAFTLLEAMCGERQTEEVWAFGLQDQGIVPVPFSEAYAEMDLKMRRPKRQWFMDLADVANSLAKYGPSCGGAGVKVPKE